MRSVRLAVGLLACIACATAIAAEATDEPVERPGRGGFYLKVSTGLAQNADSDLRLRQSDPLGDTDIVFDGVSWDDASLSGPSARYTDIRFGYFTARRPWLGFAADFLHFKAIAEVDRSYRTVGVNEGIPVDAVQPMNLIVGRFRATNGVNFIPVSAIARLRLMRDGDYPHGRVQPYAGIGVGPTLIYVQSRVNDKTRNGPYEFSDLGWQIFAGLQGHLSPRWDLFFEYKRTTTQLDGTISMGTARADLDSNHFTVGAGFHF